MASMIPCVKNDAAGWTTYISLVSQADGRVLQANPTLAAADFNIAIDDGAPGALNTTPVVDGDFTKRVKVVLSQAETNGDNLSILCSDAAGAEWCDLTINIQTAAQTLDATDVVVDSIKSSLTTVEGKINTVDTVVDSILADTDVIGSTGQGLTSLATQASVNTVDTVVDAVKVQTDKLAFTGTDVKATLDSETVTLAADQPVNVTKIAGVAVNTSTAQVGVNVVSQANIDFGATQKASIGTAIFAYVTENSKTFLQQFRLMFAALCNKVSGAGTETVSIRDDADSKDRIVATVDDDGNRSAFGTKDGS